MPVTNPPSINLYTEPAGSILCLLFLFLTRTKEMEITFPIYKKEDKDHDYHTIDGLSFLTDDIVGE